jgi:putative transposase
MKRTFTSTFVCTLPLKVTPANERHLLVRLDCARMVYNACLGESLRRLQIMQQSPGYQEAYNMPRHSPQRMKAFDALRYKYDFREYVLHTYAGQFVHSWINHHLESRTIYKMASRAFRVAKRYSFGRIGKPHFKRKGELNSVESQTNKSGIIWRENCVKWWGLELPAMIDPHDPVIAHGLESRVKLVRLVRRQFNGRNRFFAQLLCEGKPYRKEKNKIGQGVVGLDLGPSNIAIVTKDARIARLERFCD